jgi:hypothetical protein
MGQDFPFPLDISSCPVLSAIVSQVFAPRGHLYLCSRQDSASVLETVDKRLLTNCHNKITVDAGSLVTKFKFIFSYLFFFSF